MENNFQCNNKGLMSRIDERPRWSNIEELICEKKVIFLNKENLVELEGYKATVKLKEGLLEHSEIHIVLTGFSPQAAKALYEKLKPLLKHEIYSDNTSTFHSKDTLNRASDDLKEKAKE